MPVVAVFQSPNFMQERYEEFVRRVTGKSSLESPADRAVEGLLAHIAGQGDGGCRVVDVWESEAAFAAFGGTLMPILQEIGVEGRPEIFPAHSYMSA